jgi:hypothetical protein
VTRIEAGDYESMKRDPVVQVFGWLMLPTCGLGAMTGTLLAVLLFSAGMGGEPPTVTGQHSGATLVLFRHLHLFTLGVVAYSISGLIGSIGPVRGDRPWARKLWIALLIIEIGWALLIMGLEIFYPHPREPAPGAGAFFPSASTLALFSVVTFGIVSIPISAWLIHRLRNGLSARSTAAASLA